MLIHPLNYPLNSERLFECIAHLPWAVFLDSGRPESEYGRFDILVADPFITMSTVEGGLEPSARVHTEIVQSGQKTISTEDPFLILNRILAAYKTEQNTSLPFAGGALGYFGYDLARQLEKLPQLAQKNTNIPHMMVGIYDWAVLVDHQEQTASLVSHGLIPSTRDHWTTLCRIFEKTEPLVAEDGGFKPDFSLTTALTSNMTFAQYQTAFTTVKNYISAGDCYQVNLAQRFSAKAQGDSWQAYKKLRATSPAPFMAYMNFGLMQVLSGSPERFLQVIGTHVETRPIKGTMPRSDNVQRDNALAIELQASIKDQAENLMIVDLLRNDISKNCTIGSVQADKLFQLQSFANVHHLVSIVTGRLKLGKTAIDLLRGCFPGGSITGAPKLRAMQIIEALEPDRRGVYCGAIGYIGFDGNMDTNIAIRTAVYASADGVTGELSFYSGGGIVADSDVDKEYAETLDKAASLFKTMRHFQR